MIKARLQALLEEAVTTVLGPQAGLDPKLTVALMQNSDSLVFFSTAAMKLAPVHGLSPENLAEQLSNAIAAPALEVIAEEGYLNFYPTVSWLADALQAIIAGDRHGQLVLNKPGHLLSPDVVIYLQMTYRRACVAWQQAAEPCISSQGWLPALILSGSQADFASSITAGELQALLEQNAPLVKHLKNLIVLLDLLQEVLSAADGPDAQKTIKRHAAPLCRQIQALPHMWQIRSAPDWQIKARLGLILAVKKIVGDLLGIMNQPAPLWL